MQLNKHLVKREGAADYDVCFYTVVLTYINQTHWAIWAGRHIYLVWLFLCCNTNGLIISPNEPNVTILSIKAFNDWVLSLSRVCYCNNVIKGDI